MSIKVRVVLEYRDEKNGNYLEYSHGDWRKLKPKESVTEMSRRALEKAVTALERSKETES